MPVPGLDSVNLQLNAEPLYRVARRACQQFDAANRPGDRQALVLTAVTFSAFTLEAFINELPEMIALSDAEVKTAAIEACGVILAAAENERVTTLAKYQLASLALIGKTFDRGSRPFQDAQTLFDLRNAISHARPERFTPATSEAGPAFSRRKVVEALGAKNLLSPLAVDQHPLRWLITTKPLAVWACNTVVDLVQAVTAYFAGSLLGMAVQEYARRFEPPAS